MAIVLAVVIVGWLVAFALGAQAGFDNEPTVMVKQAPVAKATRPKSATRKASVSAS